MIKTCHRIDWGTVTETQLREIGKNHDAYYHHVGVFPDPLYSRIEILHDANPSMLLGFYKNITSLSSENDTDLYALSDPSWFLKNSVTGELLTDIEYPQLVALDIGNPVVQDAWANTCKKVFDNYPLYKFVMGDSLKNYWSNEYFYQTGHDEAGRPNVLNPRTGINYTNAQWNSDLATLLQKAKAKIGSKLLIPNIDIDFRLAWLNNIIPTVDGFLIEYSDKPINKGLNIIDDVGTILGKNKYVIHWRHGLSSGEELNALVKYLLSVNGKSYLCLRGLENYPNQFKGKIGNPIGDYFKYNDYPVYKRVFSKANVYWNTGALSYVVDGNEIPADSSLIVPKKVAPKSNLLIVLSILVILGIVLVTRRN